MTDKEIESKAIETCPFKLDTPTYAQGFVNGAKFGFSKANEWHYVKDKLPPIGETVLLYFGTDIMSKAVICTGRVDCKGNWYKNVDEEPIKWQEIVLPELRGE